MLKNHIEKLHESVGCQLLTHQDLLVKTEKAKKDSEMIE